ncbi:unannotated protein [freshwater metagenome]|uniref:Unannotated protein n=1 Tax=freshwater metagenome TaxID=449393 RepID=A0A6J7DY34_9ZZZZ
MRIARKAVKELAQLLVQHCVLTNSGLEIVKLRLRWQVPVDEQVSGLQEAGLLSKLFDGVSAVA